MKKVLIFLLVLLLIAACLIGVMVMGSLSISTGRCLVADNGSVMLILEGSPIVMHSRYGDGMFDGLSTGDEIMVLHDGIQETYPGGTGVYFVFRLGGGSIADIPAEVIDSLTEMGWIS